MSPFPGRKAKLISPYPSIVRVEPSAMCGSKLPCTEVYCLVMQSAKGVMRVDAPLSQSQASSPICQADASSPILPKTSLHSPASPALKAAASTAS